MSGVIPKLTRWSLAMRSLRYFWQSHATVALGIAAATAVIVGALVVGDSVRGSLRGLVLDRLANIECLLQSRTLFDPMILDAVKPLSNPAQAGAAEASLAPVMILQHSSAERTIDGATLRASGVQVIGIDASFFKHLSAEDVADFASKPGNDEVAINASLATELGVQLGDEITLRIGKLSGVPADNPLGRRDASSLSIPRQRVVAILPDAGLGGLSFVSGQAVPKNVFASLETVQDILECGERVNGVLVLTDRPSQSVDPIGDAWCEQLNSQFRPHIEDYGLKLERHRRTFPDPDVDLAGQVEVEAKPNQEPKTIHDYYQLSSDELILDNTTSDAIMAKLGGNRASRLITYLANSIAKVTPTPNDIQETRSLATELAGSAQRQERRLALTVVQVTDTYGDEPTQLEQRDTLSREVPYSIIIGLDESQELKLESFNALTPDETRVPYCWINSWLAGELNAKAGDWIEVKYFEPETVDGKEVQVDLHLMIVGIVPLVEPKDGYRRRRPAAFAEPPTVFNDPNLTPSVPGVTDQDSISNWDLPFELDLENLILPADDTYWANHRLTPKVFIPYRYASSTQMFGSRFGRTTAIRVPANQVPDEEAFRAEIEEALLTTRPSKRLVFMPLRNTQLQAASGTTPFDGLFLALSFFVIVAALLLVALLFKLGIQKRMQQLGMLSAQGFSAGAVRGMLLRELSIVALVGSICGILLGIAYARLMIAGLETWWIGAISDRFLKFSFTPTSLLLGGLAGMLASLLAIILSLRKLSQARPLALLRGEDPDVQRLRPRANRFSLALAGIALLAACGLIVAGMGQSGMGRAGSFFGSGMLLLAGVLIGLRQLIASRAYSSSAGKSKLHRGGLWELAWRAIGRNPARSSLSLGLLAVASFMIASMSVFRVSPNERGYGGFNLIAESSQPIFRNIASNSVRQDVLGPEANKLRGTSIVPLRTRQGEDASCNNLYQVSQPTIIGVPELLQQVYDLAPSTAQFEWAATLYEERPWAALEERGNGSQDNPIPVIIDQNTAAWSLKQGAGLGEIVKLELEDQTVYFRTVGLLANSVLQGKLLISEGHFESLFPKISGYNTFLIRSDSKTSEEMVASTLESGWGDVGLDVRSSKEILERLLGVQNTYISAFQSLGALGLLLGTFGLIAVQVRSVVERRRELALMQAIGFSKGRIAQLLTIETGLLLAGGLLIGVLCATTALVPYVIEVGPQLSVLSPLLMLAAVLLAGLVAAVLAVRQATSQTVLENLRSE